MITKEQFIKNINDILNDGKIENIQLPNVDLLKEIINDEDLTNIFFLEYIQNYPYDEDDFAFTKTQDFIYRLHLAVNEWLIPKHNITDSNDIKSTLLDLVFENIDLYSAVSYDDSDKEIIDDFEYLLPQKDISI